MSTESFTVRADRKVVKKLDAIAARLDRSRNYIVNEAIENFLAVESWQIAKIREGIAAADRGDVLPHKEVMARMDHYLESLDKGKKA